MQGQYQQGPPPPSSPGMYPVHHQQQQQVMSPQSYSPQGYNAGGGGGPGPYGHLPPQSPGGMPHHQQQQQQQYGSHPTLPRYASQTSMAGGPSSPSLSPLNPSAQRGGPSPNGSYMSGSSSNNSINNNNNAYGNIGNNNNNGLGSRFSSYGYGNGGPGAQGGAHPLSNALYADSPSSPTLAGDPDEMSDEKKGLASFPPSSSSSSGGDSRSSNNNKRGGPQARGYKEDGITGAYRRWSGAFISDSGVDDRHKKPERIGWLDGLRFIAAWVVINGTFFDATIGTSSKYSAIQRSSPLYIFRSFGIGLTFFLMILGRGLSAPLWDISQTPKANKDGTTSPAQPSISFPRLTRAMLVRTFRFILPVIVIAALLWGLGASNATKDCNAAGMQQPYWNLISRFSGFITVIFNSFYAFEYDTNAGRTFAGNLWTNAWFFDSSFMVFIVHMMLGNLSSSRHWIYAILGFLMWTTNNYFLPAIIGLAFSDIAAHGHFARVRKWPFMRTLAIQIVLLAIGLAFQFINPLRDNVNKGLATINVTNHTEIAFCDVIFVTCIFLIFETSKITQMVFGNIVMRMLGKLAPGMYLLSAPITFTIVPSLAVSLNNNGTSGSGILGVTWVVCFAISTVAAIPFHFLVELPSKLAGEYIVEFAERWGRVEEVEKVKGPQSKAPKKLAGPGTK